MKEYILIFMSLIFADNILFSKMLGLEFCLALKTEKKLTPLFWIATIVLSVITAIGSCFLAQSGISPLVCTGIFAIVGVIGGYLFDLAFGRSKASHTFATALAMNTAFLGIAYSVSTVENITKAAMIGISYGIGLMLSAVMINCIEERVKYSRPPKMIGKALLILICVAIVAMAFSAFDGFELRYENINS